jgi:hypothetical protein
MKNIWNEWHGFVRPLQGRKLWRRAIPRFREYAPPGAIQIGPLRGLGDSSILSPRFHFDKLRTGREYAPPGAIQMVPLTGDIEENYVEDHRITICDRTNLDKIDWPQLFHLYQTVGLAAGLGSQ